MPAPVPDFDRTADAYRRRILARRTGPDTVVCDLEDDFHHFRVTLTHAGGAVTAVAGTSVRWPWRTCPDAAAGLAGLVGMPLTGRFTAAARRVDPRGNCTHQFDAASHAIVHAHRGTGERRYDVEVHRWTDDLRSRVRLWVDGHPTIDWTLDRRGIVAPAAPFTGAPWQGGFMAWADAQLDPEPAEAAIVARRGATIGMGRGWPFDDFDRAADTEIGTSGVCYTMTAGRAEVAWREHGMIRDFASRPEDLVGGDASAG